MKIYADNAATTRVSDTALAAMTPCFQEIYGNPSSLHTPGQRAAAKLAAARAIFARNLHADPREITFTSGGSEADNQALRTAAALGEKRGKRHIVSTKFEHHAVLHTLQALERENCPSLDRTADTFARLLAGAAPASGDAARDRALGQLLYHVGRWIYLVDAWDDLADDRRTGSYNPISARFGGETEANRDYLRTTLRHSLNLARSAAALLELGHWRETVENILFLGLPMVEELVFTGRWKAVNQHNRRQNP